MQTHKPSLLIPLITALSLVLLPALAAAGSRQMIAAVTDGHGRVDLAWLVSPADWPAGGWRLEEMGKKKILAAAIRPGSADTEAISGPEKEKLINQVNRVIAAAQTTDRTKAGLFLLLENMHDFSRLKVMGLGWTLAGVSPGTHRYRVSALDRNGKKSGPVLETGPIDTSRASPPPKAPARLRAENNKDSVLLRWQEDDPDSLLAALRFRIERTNQDGRVISLPPKSFRTTGERKSGRLRYLDRQPPPEERLGYRVIGQDIFGRDSAAASVSIFHPDPLALAPPAKLTARAEKNSVHLSWQPCENPFTRGYLIERSPNIERGFDLLTAKPLDPKTTQYTDRKGLVPGLSYFYRIRSVNGRGRIGKPGLYVSAVPESAGPPAAPQKLKAEVRPARVRLSWQAPRQGMAGYLIEKKAQGKDKWQVLNGVAETRTLYDDPVGPEDYGTFSYRVIAIGYDNKKSKPSREVKVRLSGRAPVPAPHLRDIRWRDGAVHLSFSRAEPKELVHSLLVIRGIGRQDHKGIIIGEPLKAKATSFEDTRIRPGHDYWYALIGVGEDGRRSPPSNRLFIRTGSGKISTPERPRLFFAEKPFPHVKVGFARPPEPLLASVMRRDSENGPWLTIASGIGGSDHIIDADPPRTAKAWYRVLYLNENHVTGSPSKAASLDLPGQDN